MDTEILLRWWKLTTLGSYSWSFLFIPTSSVKGFMVRIVSEGSMDYSMNSYQLGTANQILQLEMIHSRAFFDLHIVVFEEKLLIVVIAAVKCNWTGNRNQLLSARKSQNDFFSRVDIQCLMCWSWSVTMAQVTSSAKPDAVSLVWGCRFSIAFPVGHFIKVTMGILFPKLFLLHNAAHATVRGEPRPAAYNSGDNYTAQRYLRNCLRD